MMRRLGRWVGGLFSKRARSLKGIRERTAVLIEGRIDSDNVVQSPVSPVRAVILTAAILDEHVLRRQEQAFSHGGLHDDVTHYEVRARVQLNGPFVVATEHGRVLVPQVEVKVDYRQRLTNNPVPLVTVPEMFREVIATADDRTSKYYNEAFICRGDEVELRAVVRPVEAGSGPYRGSGAGVDHDFVAVVEAERPTLIER